MGSRIIGLSSGAAREAAMSIAGMLACLVHFQVVRQPIKKGDECGLHPYNLDRFVDEPKGRE
jgi:hypothetical protein